jgi:hypothetical protein
MRRPEAFHHNLAALLLLTASLTGCAAEGEQGETGPSDRVRPRLSTTPERCVVRVEVPRARVGNWQEISAGTGVLLDDGRAITAYHILFKGYGGRLDELRVTSWERDRGQAQNLTGNGGTARASPELDLVVVDRCDVTTEVDGATLTRTLPQIGDRVTAFGMGGGDRRQLRAHVVGFSTCGRWFSINVPTIHGDSGGPVFDSNGHVIGIILGGAPPITPFEMRVNQNVDAIFESRSVFESVPCDGRTLVLNLAAVLR